MKTAPNTLTTPSEILAGVQAFNEDATGLLKRGVGGGLNTLYFAKLVEDLAKKHRGDVLVAMDADLARLHEELVEAGISLEGED